MLANLTNRNCDRFIHSRNHFKTSFQSSPNPKTASEYDTTYNHLIRKQLMVEQDSQSFVSTQESLTQFCQSHKQSEGTSKLNNNVESPVKVLDVPSYQDDFYFNNIDWSERGTLGIALENEVFLYSPENVVEVKKGPSSGGGIVTGLKIEDYVMAIGHSNGSTELYDLEKCCIVRTLSKHENRVSALTFMDSLLITGSKDKSILVNDLREKRFVVRDFQRHKGEVCTLKVKNQNQKIFASGSADGTAIIWDLHFGFIDQLKAHKGAVKALDWCPWKSGLLATGGGNNEQRSIKIWNTNNSNLLTKTTFSSQVSSIVWNEELQMLISSHGYSENSLNFWSLDSVKGGNIQLRQKKKFNAHSGRILNMVQSYDQSYICTVGSDQNLKFWHLFSKKDSNPFNNTYKGQKQEDSFFRL